MRSLARRHKLALLQAVGSPPAHPVMKEALLDPGPEFVLRGVAGSVFGRSYHLISPTTIGRSPECDVCLPEAAISRSHARLRPTFLGLEIEDLKSTNGSFLNGQRINMAVARAGDEIAFDRLRFRVEEVGSASSRHRRGRSEGSSALRVAFKLLLAAGALVLAGLALRTILT